MFRQIVFSACLAGLLAGLVLTGLQFVTTVPIILEAESYEGGEAGEHSHGSDTAASEPMVESSGGFNQLYQAIYSFQHAESNWEPEDGWQRNSHTLIANILIAIGFGLLLGAAFSLRQSVGWTQGLLWGLGGYAVFFAFPALGLTPEIPGAYAADLVPRQGWWLFTVVCSAVGLALIVLRNQWAWKIAGAALVVTPHLIGAPLPEVHGGTAPQALADAFVWATAFVNAVFWLILGAFTALAFKRLTREVVDA